MKYNFDEIIDRKHTYSTQWDYIIDRFGTNDITPFSISDTDFRMPYEVSEMLKKASEMPIFGYTRWNHDDYKGSIVNYYQSRFNTAIDPNWILYAPSVMYSLSLLIELLSKEGDYIAAFSPMYTDFEDCTLIRNRKMIRVFMDNDHSYYRINQELLEDALKKAKVFLLCSPHNPTGRVFDYDELKLIVELCKKYHVALVADEIHMDIVYSKKQIPILNFIQEYPMIFSISSGSKTFNYPSLGGSYVLIPDSKIRSDFNNITKHRDFVNSANYIGMMAMITSYNESKDYVEELNTYLYHNMEIVKEYIDHYCSPLEFKIPEGTYLAWIDCRKLNVDCNLLQDALINIGKVGIMKGETYFEEHYLRMNIACPRKKLMTGLEGIRKAVVYLQEHK